MLYISLKEATKYCNYSQDYLKLRAWQGKLKAVKIGRNWTTTKKWLQDYLTKIAQPSYQTRTRFIFWRQRPQSSLWCGGQPQPRLARTFFLIFLILCLLIIGGIFSFQLKYSVDTFKAYFYWMEKQTASLKLEKIIPARVIEIK